MRRITGKKSRRDGRGWRRKALRVEQLEERRLLSVSPAAEPEAFDDSWLYGTGPSALVNLPDFGSSALPSTLPPASSEPRTPGSRVFHVYVETGLLSAIQGSLTAYQTDLVREGYQVTIEEFDGSAAELRADLQTEWSVNNLEGALFVGDLPYLDLTTEDNFGSEPAESTYPHDLYFMDLDGSYTLNTTGVDEHTAGGGDVGPEIYISRLTTGNLGGITGKGEAQLINEYFDKVRSYRSGDLTYKDRGVVFADDDWSGWGASEMDGLYAEVLAVNDPAVTNKSTYLRTLALNYESVLECLHSGPQGHGVKVGDSWESISNTELRDANPRAGFYNMFNCSGALFTVPDNLIGTYVYGGDYGLNAVGTTKTGSMLNFPDFYGPQGDGATVGQAFMDWFNLNAAGTDDPGNDWRVDWFYGMTMQGDPTLSVHDVLNDPPTVTLAAAITTISEAADTTSRIKVADITVTDDELGTNLLSLSGADSSMFEIVGSALFLKAGATLDFETNASLDVTVDVDDATVGETPDDSETLSITVTDVNEAPALALNILMTELSEAANTTSRIKVADITVTDDAIGTNALGLFGADAALFVIADNALYLRAGTVLDYETNPVLDVLVTVNDPTVGSNPDDIDVVSIAIVNVDEGANRPPTLVVNVLVETIPETANTANRIAVAFISVTDDAIGTNALGVFGADAAFFEIADSVLYLRAGAALDYETNPTLVVLVTVNDPTVGTSPDDIEVVSIAITDVDEVTNQPPTVTLNVLVQTIPESANTANRTAVAGIVVTDDGLGTNTLGLLGADAALFVIADNMLYLRAGAALDYETNSTLDVTVTVNDPTVGSNPDDQVDALIHVGDVNEPPAVALLNTVTSLVENADTLTRTKVADIEVSDDQLGTEMLALSGADAAMFEIIGSVLYLRAGMVLDYEANPALDVTVAVNDPSVGSTPDDTDSVTIAVTDVNEAPALALNILVTTLSEAANTTSQIKVADITVTDDALGTESLGLFGNDAALFQIVDNVLYLRAGAALDYETNPVLDVFVTVNDPTVGTSPDDIEVVSITIVNVDEVTNQPPTVTLNVVVQTIPETANTANRTAVGFISVTDDGLGTNTLGLFGADAGLFEIADNVLYLRAGAALDYETNPTLEVSVTVNDPTIGSNPDDQKDASIQVADVNEPPAVALLNTVTSLAENAGTLTRTKVADIEVSDDQLGTETLALSGADAAMFEIVRNVLYLKAGVTLDFETNPALNVTVAVNDLSVGSTPDDTDSIAIAVTDVNEAPALALNILVTTLSEAANTTSQIKVADITVTDDALGTEILGLFGNDATLFQIADSVLYLRAGAALDYETNPVLDVFVTVNDPTVGSNPDDIDVVSIAIVNVNEAPTVALLNVLASLDENASTATPIKAADIVVTDDNSATVALTLSGDDAAKFQIVGRVLYLKAGAVLDFEENPVLDVTVAVNDPSVGETPDDSEAISIAINDIGPDIRITSLGLNGAAGLFITYFISEAAVDPFEIGFYRSANKTFDGDVQDTQLDSVLVNAAADLSVGSHTKSYAIGRNGDQISLPGAGASDVDGDYFLLAVADHEDAILESDEANNTAVIRGVYHQAGGLVMVHGTSGNDVFTIRPASTTNLSGLRVGVNGATYTYSAYDFAGVRIRGLEGNDQLQFTAGGGFGSILLLGFAFQGGAGTNTAEVVGSTSTVKKDVVKLYATKGDVTGPGYMLSLTGMCGITAKGNGGPDEAYLYDSSLDDTFTATPAYAELSNDRCTNRAEGFRDVWAYAQVGGAYGATGGKDTAVLYGKDGAKDFLRASAMYAIMADSETGRGVSYFVRANWFEEVDAFGRNVGGRPSAVDRDQAILYDAASRDFFEADATTAVAKYEFAGASTVSANAFRVVKAFGSATDTANLYGPGTYNPTPTPVMYTNDYTVWANGFGRTTYDNDGPSAPSSSPAAIDAALMLMFEADQETSPTGKKTVSSVP